MNELTKKEEVYPNAMVPGAQTPLDVIKEWSLQGLAPIEISEEQAIREINISINLVTGNTRWTIDDRLDGMQALSALAAVTHDAFKHHILPADRKKLKGDMQILVQLKDGTPQVAFNPPADVTLARGVLAAALISMLNESSTSPASEWAEMFTPHA